MDGKIETRACAGLLGGRDERNAESAGSGSTLSLAESSPSHASLVWHASVCSNWHPYDGSHKIGAISISHDE